MALVKQSHDITVVSIHRHLSVLVVAGQLFKNTAAGQLVEKPPPKELAETRELDSQPLVDASSDWLV